ncbi:MAG TPA: class I SAM-dependent methyltransferase [Acidimicrobiia bacterium]
MSFVVAADSYDRFMGRYSSLLAPIFADFAGVDGDQTVIEVGCGPGALTSVLVDRLGAGAVTAVDPSPPFVAAARERFPGVTVQESTAESLPFDEDVFDLSLAQLVVHHMSDPIAGIAEMARVTRPGGTVAACVWDLGAGRDPLSPFWRAVRRYDPTAIGESGYAGTREGHLLEIFEDAGLAQIDGEGLVFEVEHSSFEEWWDPFKLGVGPAGAYAAGLPPEDQAILEALCREELPTAPFTLSLRAWAARGTPSTGDSQTGQTM